MTVQSPGLNHSCLGMIQPTHFKANARKLIGRLVLFREPLMSLGSCVKLNMRMYCGS